MKLWVTFFLGFLVANVTLGELVVVDPEGGSNNYHQALRTYRHIGTAFSQAMSQWISGEEHSRTKTSTLKKDLPSLNISEPCLDKLLLIIGHISPSGAPPEWVVRFLDSQAKPPSAILEGNIGWLGGFHECMNLTVYENATNPTQESKLLEGQYCLVTIGVGEYPNSLSKKASGLMQIPKALRAGLCVPNTCSVNDVKNLVQFGLETLEDKVPQLVKDNLSITEVRCPAKEIPLNGSSIAVIVILVTFATIVLMATMYDVLTTGLFLDSDDQALMDRSLSSPSDYTSLLPPDAMVAAEQEDTQVKKGRSFLAKICSSLSAVSNSRRIFRSRAIIVGELPWIHGLRVLSMAWIILGQTYALGLPVFDNLVMLPEAMKGLFTQIIVQSTFAVDTFLFLSGFLVAHRFLKELAGGFDCFRLIRFYVSRYARLFPVYMVVLGVYAALTKYISSGPLWPQDEMMLGNCSHLAWTNAFYINNYVQAEQMCMPWTWYIAIDFQLFVFAPLIVLALSAVWQAGVALCGVCVLAAVIASGVISKVMELPPSLVGFGSTDISAFDQDLTMKYFTNYLITTYCRAAPYFIGILAAFFLRDPPNVRKMGFLAVCLGWIGALLGISIVVFGLIPGFNQHPISVDTAAAFNSLSHVVWAGALVWIAYSCTTGAVKLVNHLLGLTFWRPLSCVSYSVYLISPIIICLYYLSREEMIRFSHWNIMTIFWGNLVFSLIIGFCLYIFIEAPVRNVVRLLLSRRVSRSSSLSADDEKI